MNTLTLCILTFHSYNWFMLLRCQSHHIHNLLFLAMHLLWYALLWESVQTFALLLICPRDVRADNPLSGVWEPQRSPYARIYEYKSPCIFMYVMSVHSPYRCKGKCQWELQTPGGNQFVNFIKTWQRIKEICVCKEQRYIIINHYLHMGWNFRIRYKSVKNTWESIGDDL